MLDVHVYVRCVVNVTWVLFTVDRQFVFTFGYTNPLLFHIHVQNYVFLKMGIEFGTTRLVVSHFLLMVSI